MVVGVAERGEKGEQGCPWPRGSTPAPPAQFTTSLAPWPLCPSPFYFQVLPPTFRYSLPSALPLCPLSPGLLESVHSANAAPCPSASSCPAHSAAVSASWMLVVVEELAQGGGTSQFKLEYLRRVQVGRADVSQSWGLRQDWTLNFLPRRDPRLLLISLCPAARTPGRRPHLPIPSVACTPSPRFWALMGLADSSSTSFWASWLLSMRFSASRTLVCFRSDRMSSAIFCMARR